MRARQLLAIDSAPGDELIEGESFPVSRPFEQIFLHLDDRGFVPFHPALAERFGHKAAIFTGIALYWTRYSLRKYPERCGWFSMSMEQWRNQIGLTRSEQSTVREALMASGVLEEMLLGRPAVMNYRLNVPALARALSINSAKSEALTWDLANSWFRGCRHYYKPLADIAGNIAAGLYLAFLLQRHRECLKLGQLDSGCICVSQDEISGALVLGSKVQRNARERLKKAGLISESGIGGILVRINFEAILLCLRGQTTKPLPRTRKSQSAPGVRAIKSAHSSEQHVQPLALSGLSLSGLSFSFTQLQLGLDFRAQSTRSRPRDLLMQVLHDESVATQPVGFRQLINGRESLNAAEIEGKDKRSHDRAVRNATPDASGCTNPVAVSCKLEKSGFAETCKLDTARSAETCKQELPFPAIYIQEDFNKTTTTETEEQHRPMCSSCCAEDKATSKEKSESKMDAAGLIFPKWLEESDLSGVLKMLTQVGAAERQLVLDELDGANAITSIQSPIGWLRGLVKNMRENEVVFAHAHKVAAKREAQKKHLQLMEAQRKASLASAALANVEAPKTVQGASDAKKRFLEKAKEQTAALKLDMLSKKSRAGR